MIRSVVSVLSGAVVAVLTYWAGAVVVFVLQRGIPLGSAGGPPTGPEVAGHLAIAAAAVVPGAALTIRLSRGSPRRHVGALALVLALGAVPGFGKPGSQWPSWFGTAMAATLLLAGGAVALVTRQR